MVVELLLDRDLISDEHFDELDLVADDWSEYDGIITALFSVDFEIQAEAIESQYEYCAV